jgi:diketogulonate reductase-like aldo/keto reductase
MAAHGILAEAYSPLGQGAALDEEPVVEIARRHEKTPAQVVIRWHLQLGNVVIPKSATTARIRANAEVFDFELSPDEMNVFAELDSGQKLGPDPATFIEP